MARKQLAPGDIGVVRFRERTPGRVTATAGMRDLAGVWHDLRAVGATEDEARLELERQARQIVAIGRGERLTETSTVAEAVEVWLEGVRVGNRVTPQTVQTHEVSGRRLVRAMGAVRLADLRPGFVEDFLHGALAREGSAAAHALKGTLRLVCGVAVRRGALVSNPVRDTSPLPAQKTRASALTPEQFHELIQAIEEWAGKPAEPKNRGGVRSDARALADLLSVCVGTGARIGEALALERRDLDFENRRVHIRSTLVFVKGQGTIRQEHTKTGPRGARTVPMTARVREVLERRLDGADSAATTAVFRNRSGGHTTQDRMAKRLRAFRAARPEVLERLGIPASETTSHLMRRSALTLVANTDALGGGSTAAAMLGGHANESTTRRHYAHMSKEVPETTSQLLDAFWVSAGRAYAARTRRTSRLTSSSVYSASPAVATQSSPSSSRATATNAVPSRSVTSTKWTRASHAVCAGMTLA
ncbi:site-specific integrase [Microbacterium protaetiae]|uniref:Site-specific integrase n=1 Tax=Microbacterium protaetiae TaxID=2509458 RepID=A0A4P6EF85_9MICO|nr:site-specific integrase [Microbacterium protaetiae]QAY60914.1 site-specific integrase [Microbacterium protaetiae]